MQTSNQKQINSNLGSAPGPAVYMGNSSQVSTDINNPSPVIANGSGSDISHIQHSKKFPGGKFIATLLGLLLLVGGSAAGIFLVRQPQNVSEKAYVSCDFGCGEGYTCRSGRCVRTTGNDYYEPTSDNDNRDADDDGYLNYDEATANGNTPPPEFIAYDSSHCAFDSDCANGYLCGPENKCVGNIELAKCGRDADPQAPVCCTDTKNCPGDPSNIVCETPARKECKSKDSTGKEYYCLMEANSSWCSGNNIDSNTPATNIPTPTAVCYNIKVYDINWNQLTLLQLSKIKPGDIVRFSVQGQTSSGTFTKARFTINGVERPETAVKKPGSEEFYDEYTVPQALTTLAISAQIYHDILGWR